MESLKTQVQELPNQVRAKAEGSLFFTGQALLGYDKLTPHLHFEMCKVMEAAEKYKRVLMLVPRDHYKTTVCTITYPTWRSMRNPNDAGLVVLNTMTNAQRKIGVIRKHWENRPLLRSLYWDRRPELSDRWNKDELCLPREKDRDEATWTAAGYDTRVTSGHFDYIIYDDVVDEETYESAELMAKLEARFEQREGLLRPPVEEKPIIVVMNHWSTIDLACRIIEKHPEYYVYYRQAIEDGEPIFPEMYTLKWLLRKQEVDPYLFANQWMNNPTDPSVVELKPGWLQYYKRGDNAVIIGLNGDRENVPLGFMNIYMTVDPRHTLANTRAEKLTSRNAITVGGIDHHRRRFLLEEWASRSGPSELVKKMLEMWQRWRHFGIISCGIESFGYQAALQPLALEIWRDETYKPRLELLPRDTTKSKNNRIRGGTDFFAEDKAFIHRSHVYFKEEYDTFPHGRTKDVLDCWAWLMHMMDPPGTADDRRAEEEQDRAYMQSLRSRARI